MTNLQVILLLYRLLEFGSAEETVPSVNCRSLLVILVLVVLVLLMNTFLVELADDGE